MIIRKGNINGSDFANMWLWGPAGSDQLVWGTACNWTGTSINPGPLVEDFATAISSLRDFQTTSPRAITLSGHSGMEVKLTVPSDANLRVVLERSRRAERVPELGRPLLPAAGPD